MAAQGLFPCSWTPGAAPGAASEEVEAQLSLGPISGGEEGLEPGGPAPRDPTGRTTCATPAVAFGGHSRGGLVSKLSSSTQARVGWELRVENFFLHSMEKVEGSTD